MPHRLVVILFLLYIILQRLPRVAGVSNFAPPLAFNELKNGDLLLFSSRSVDGGVMQAWMNQPFTHIGLYYDGAIWNCDVESGGPCLLCNTKHEGVQLQELSEKITAASGCVYSISVPESMRVPQLNARWMSELCQSVKFRHSLCALMHAALPSIVPHLACTQSELLCTELVALTIHKYTGKYLRRQCTPLDLAREIGVKFTDLRSLTPWR